MAIDVHDVATREPHEYDTYPDWFPIRTAEVELITGMNRSTINKRVKAGLFPAPMEDPANGRQMWQLGVVRRWCFKLFGEPYPGDK